MCNSLYICITIETRAYDKADRLISILDKCRDTVVNQQEYSYDASENITAVKALESGLLDFGTVASAEMTYDANNRLVKAGDTSYFSRIYSAKTEDKFTLSSVAFSLVILSLIGYNKINDNILIKL